MAEKVTSLQVAERAGVSQSAVSRVFTPGASVSKATAEKVREAARELGYRPNVLARAMITGRSRMIGLVVAYLENQFYPVALELLSNELQARGYHILIFTAPNSTDGIDAVMQDLMDYQIDGIIAASVSMSSDQWSLSRDVRSCAASSSFASCRRNSARNCANAGRTWGRRSASGRSSSSSD